MSQKKLKSLSGIIFSTDPNYKLEKEEEPEVTLPSAQQILKVRLDKKHRAGKSVTLITGFTGTNDDLQELGKQLKSFCGTGGSVKEGDIIVQGDNREKILQWLHKNEYTLAR